MDWISTEDEWPKDFSDVWVTNGQQTYIANVKNVVGGLSCAIFGNSVAVVMNVTHWMPLVPPTPPAPKLTVSRETLYDALEWIERAVECCQSNSTINVSSIRPGVAYNDLLPRLRAALESE